MTQKKDIATRQETAVDINRSPRGFDNFKMEDLIIPRVRLLQGLSKAVSDGEGKMGQFQDSLTGELVGDSLELVLLGMKNGAVYFKTGKGMICKSNDGIISVKGDVCRQCPYKDEFGNSEYWGKFHEDGSPPGCSGTKEFITLKKDSVGSMPYPMLLSFLKTSYGLGKRLASMARLSGEDIFARSYVIGSEKVQNDKGTFSKFTIKQGEKLTEDELKIAEKWYELIGRVNVIAHEDDEVVSDI